MQAKMSVRAAMLLCVPAVLAATASADMWPHRKPGLWQMTMTMQGAPMPPMKSKYCVDAATESALIAAGQNAANKMCKSSGFRMTGGAGSVDAVCKFDNITSTSHTTIMFAGDSAYHSETRSHMSPAPAYMKADSVMTSDARWIGPCPAGMKPGDAVLANGMHMHLDPNAMNSKMPGGKRANDN